MLPERNKFDLEDVPDEVKQSMKFVFAQTVDDVLKAALEAPKSSRRARRKTAARSSHHPRKKANDKGRTRRG